MYKYNAKVTLYRVKARMPNEEDCAQGQEPSHIKRHTATETETRNTQQQDLCTASRRANEAEKSADQRTLHQERLTDRILERTTSIHCTCIHI